MRISADLNPTKLYGSALCCSYALGITGRLSGLVSTFTETEKELVAVERCTQYIHNIQPENFKGPGIVLFSPKRVC
jgi:hypothetical protein